MDICLLLLFLTKICITWFILIGSLVSGIGRVDESRGGDVPDVCIGAAGFYWMLSPKSYTSILLLVVVHLMLYL